MNRHTSDVWEPYSGTGFQVSTSTHTEDGSRCGGGLRSLTEGIIIGTASAEKMGRNQGPEWERGESSEVGAKNHVRPVCMVWCEVVNRPPVSLRRGQYRLCKEHCRSQPHRIAMSFTNNSCMINLIVAGNDHVPVDCKLIVRLNYTVPQIGALWTQSHEDGKGTHLPEHE